MRILVAPGQGSQSKGFLTPWLEAFPSLRQSLVLLGEASGVDLLYMGTEADEDTIRDTAVAQPLIVGASLGIARATNIVESFQGFAGHSVGEFAAAALAGVITDEEALHLVGIRGRAMAKAAAAIETGMAAILGSDEEQIASVVKDLGLSIANYNGGGQYVAAGKVGKLATLAANPPERVRVIPLKVAGAFHTQFMESAVAELKDAVSAISPNDPRGALWSNYDGGQLKTGTEVMASLVAQVARPVRWDLCMKQIANAGVNLAVELPPAGTLAGLLKRAAPSTNPLALKTPADLERI